MDVKWRRHYRETTSTLSVALILFGTCFLLALGFIWPQHYSAIVFNSKMEYRTIVDAKDYWTCDPDYINFVFDEPTVDEALLQMYGPAPQPNPFLTSACNTHTYAMLALTRTLTRTLTLTLTCFLS